MSDLIWRKTNRSQEQGACVELADLGWRKSSYTNVPNNDCVEVAPHCAVVAVRDSKHPDGDILELGPRAFASLARGLKA